MATMPYTYNQVVKFFSDFATNHYQIHSFGNGDLWESMESNQAAHLKYPKLWLRPISATVGKPYSTIRLGLVVMDLVNKDESNEDEVLSDMLGIMQDVIATLNLPTYSNTFVVGDGSLTPFTERFSAEVTGWAMEFDFKILWTEDNCAVPISGAPSFTRGCAGVTIYDSNGAVITVVPSGGTYTDSNTCLDATVENSDASYSQAVASGGTLVLADTTFSWYLNGVLQTTSTVASLVNQTFNINFV